MEFFLKAQSRKKLMFFPASMKGHLVHTARISEWFLEHPEEYEVHICASPDCEEWLPQGIVFHANNKSQLCKDFEKVFTAVSEGLTQMDSLRIMFSQMDFNRITEGTLEALAKVKEVKPDVVIYEHAYNISNAMQTLLVQMSIPGIMMVAMARPESALSLSTIFALLFRSPRATYKVMSAVSSSKKIFEDAIGAPLLAEDCKPPTMYPGEHSLAGLPIAPHELYTGPFYPLPIDRLTSPTKSGRHLLRSTSSRFSMDYASFEPKFAQWVEARRQEGLPIIYIALGTLAMPSTALLERMVAALDGGNWAVIWACPEAHQARLPAFAHPSRWFVHKFLPQAAIFQQGFVKAFVSHCGGSSTTEAISNGIPMVCVPFFGDQYEWAESICSHVQAGVRIDKTRSSAGDIRSAVQDVVTNKKYITNAEAAMGRMTSNAKMRLDFLGPKLAGIPRRVGIPVAAAAIENCLNGKDPLDVLPDGMRFKPKPASNVGICGCFAGLVKAPGSAGQ